MRFIRKLCGVLESSGERGLDMKLWTWQNKKLDITDSGQKVHAGESYGEIEEHRNAYSELYRRIGHDQFHWYSTTKEGADSHVLELEALGSVGDYQLWEVTVDETSILHKVCGITWAWILGDGGGSAPPFWQHYFSMHISEPWDSREEFRDDLYRPWSNLEPSQLWGHLFVDAVVPGCTQVLLKHPVDPSCAKRIDEVGPEPTGQSGQRPDSCPLCAGCLTESSLHLSTEKN